MNANQSDPRIAHHSVSHGNPAVPHGNSAAATSDLTGAGAADYRRRLYGHYVTTLVGVRGQYSDATLARHAAWLAGVVGRFIPTDRRAEILDIGCGWGALLWFLRQRGYSNARGIDASAEQVALAHARGIPGVERAEAVDYLLGHQATFDFMTAVDVLEHIPKPEVLPFLDSVLGALKPGGHFLIHTANGAGPFGGRYLYADFTHETAFTPTSIEQLLREAGFERIATHEVQPVRHGALSSLRWALWQALHAVLVGYLAVETGVIRGHVLTQNLVAVARKPARG